MPVELPEPIAAYFQADRGDATAVASCFTPDAVVKDEGKTYSGTLQIERWKAEASAKYNYTSEAAAIREDSDWIVITAHTAGDFPGSPVDLRYFFRLVGDKIVALEIRP